MKKNSNNVLSCLFLPGLSLKASLDLPYETVLEGWVLFSFLFLLISLSSLLSALCSLLFLRLILNIVKKFKRLAYCIRVIIDNVKPEVAPFLLPGRACFAVISSVSTLFSAVAASQPKHS